MTTVVSPVTHALGKGPSFAVQLVRAQKRTMHILVQRAAKQAKISEIEVRDRTGRLTKAKIGDAGSNSDVGVAFKLTALAAWRPDAVRDEALRMAMGAGQGDGSVRINPFAVQMPTKASADGTVDKNTALTAGVEELIGQAKAILPDLAGLARGDSAPIAPTPKQTGTGTTLAENGKESGSPEQIGKTDSPPETGPAPPPLSWKAKLLTGTGLLVVVVAIGVGVFLTRSHKG